MVPLTERYKLEFAGFFNLPNHAQYAGGYVNDVFSNGFTGSRNDLPNSPLFGRLDQFYSSNSRSLQIVARFTF